jgi:hypothetical protein
MKKISLILLFITSTCYSQVPDTHTGLLRHWAFDETSGTKSFDTIGFDTFSITGLTVGITGNFGKAVQQTSLNDQQGFSSLSNNLGLDGLNEFTVSLWTNWNTSPRIGDSCRFFMNVNGYVWTGYYQGTGTIYYYVDNSNGVTISTETSGVTFSVGTWYNIVFTYKKNDYMRVYINTVVRGSQPTQNYPVRTSSAQTYLGAYLNGINNGDLRSLDDLAVFNYALSQTEIDNIYNNSYPAPTIPTIKRKSKSITFE